MQETQPLSENVQMYSAKGEQKPFICVAFGGISMGLGTPVFEFMRTLSTAGISSLFIKDPSQGWYQRPIDGFGSNPAEMAATLTEILRKHFPGKRVIAVGNSMGGFAAIAFGCLSALDRAVVFSPQTFIDPHLREEHGDTRWQTQMNEIPKIHIGDLRSLLSTNRLVVDVYAGEKTALDVAHAQHLKGLQTVNIHLLSDCGHDVSKWLRSQGKLEEIILEAGMNGYAS